MEIAVYPIGTGDFDISREVSGIFDVLDRCGLTYEITVMGTVVEGTPDELFNLAQKLHDVMFSDTVKRVMSIMRIDESRSG